METLLLDAVRRHQQEKQNLEQAVDQALDEMPENYMIRELSIFTFL